MNAPVTPLQPSNQDATSSRTIKLVRVGSLVFVAVLLLVAFQLGWLQQLANPTQFRHNLLALGGWGFLVFVLSYTVFQPFGVPGTVFIMVAPLIWSWPIAFAASMLGTMAASIVGFSFARFVARDWVSRRIPERFRKYENALETKGFSTVFFLRFVFWMPPVLHAFFGVSKVRFSAHFWGSLAGYALPIFLTSYFGEAIFAQLKNLPVWVWIVSAAVLVVTASGYLLYRRRALARETLAALQNKG